MVRRIEQALCGDFPVSPQRLRSLSRLFTFRLVPSLPLFMHLLMRLLMIRNFRLKVY